MTSHTKTDRSGSAVYKTASATILKVNEGDGGTDLGGFDALVAVFDNVDSQGDKVIKGAFAEALAARETFPSLWSHQFNDDSAVIASAWAEETDEGLLWHASFLDTDRAQNVRKLMAAGLIREFSWSGRVKEGGWINAEGEGPWGDGYYEIRKVDLWEAGPCFIGANSETELLGVKSSVERLATKEGRVLAQKHVDALTDAHSILGDVLAAVTKVDETKAVESPPEPPQDPSVTTPDETNASADAGAFVISPITKARLALS